MENSSSRLWRQPPLRGGLWQSGKLFCFARASLIEKDSPRSGEKCRRGRQSGEQVDASVRADGRSFFGHTYFTLPAFTQNAKGCIIYTVSVRRSALQILQKELQRTMKPTDRNAAKPRLTRAQWKRRKRLRLARNWAILILVCAAIVALMTKGILWLLPKVNTMLAGPQSFDAASYDGTGYSFDADDERFVLVNSNLPFAEEPSPNLADADEASGIQLEAEAAAAYQKMAAAAAEDGVELVLTAGYQDADARTAAYETQKQQYLEKGKTEEEAASLAADIQPPAECNDHGTGYAADILSTDYPTRDTGFDTTRAYEWLTAYAAEYGFILRYPQDRQAATGVVFEPWHWRYVGVENALAIRASGLSLEEFLALQKAS